MSSILLVHAIEAICIVYFCQLQRKKDLDELDKKRHENFKHHEMQLAHQRKEKLRQMDEKARLEAEEKYITSVSHSNV